MKRPGLAARPTSIAYIAEDAPSFEPSAPFPPEPGTPRFYGHVEHPHRRRHPVEEGPGWDDLVEALAWAASRADAVAVRLGWDDVYVIGREPGPGERAWPPAAGIEAVRYGTVLLPFHPEPDPDIQPLDVLVLRSWLASVHGVPERQVVRDGSRFRWRIPARDEVIRLVFSTFREDGRSWQQVRAWSEDGTFHEISVPEHADVVTIDRSPA